MKKIFTILFLVAFSLLIVNVTKAQETPVDQLPASCIAYNDGCNMCSKNTENGQWMCTLRACDIATTYMPVCTAYAPGSTSTGSSNDIMCTAQYAPVCASVAVECFTTPCPPIHETFGNTCELSKNPQATLLYVGECKGDLKAGEGTVYGKVSAVLDQSYLVWKFTPIQAYNYTQTIINKIDNKLMVSRMRKWAYDKHIQLKRFLQTYMNLLQITN